MTDFNRAEEILSAEECNETGREEENKPVDKIEKSSEGKDSGELNVVKGIGNEGLEKHCEESKRIDEKQSVQDKELGEQKDDSDVNEFNVIKKETEQRKQCETKSNDEDIQNVTENCTDKINQRVLLDSKDNHCAETGDKKQSVVENEDSKKTSAVGAILLSVRKLTSQTNNDTAKGKDNKKVGPIQCLTINVFLKKIMICDKFVLCLLKSLSAMGNIKITMKGPL